MELSLILNGEIIRKCLLYRGVGGGKRPKQIDYFRNFVDIYNVQSNETNRNSY